MKKILLIAAVFAVSISNNSFGLSAFVDCVEDCYKCVRYMGANCIQCEYDENYCAETAACIDDSDCPANTRCNTTTGDCLPYVSVLECDAGQYLLGEVCNDCPTYSGATTSCTPQTNDGGVGGITSCFYSSTCQFSDDTGTFVFTSDCAYTDSGDLADKGEIAVPGKPILP